MREKKEKEKEEDQTLPEIETGTNLRHSKTHPSGADHDVQEGFPHPLRLVVANPVANPVATLAVSKHPPSRSLLTTLLIWVAEMVRVVRVEVEEEGEEEARRN